MKKNDEITLEITSMSSEGYGIGRYENIPVFVPLTAVGDTVKVVIVKDRKTYFYGKLLEIITPSEDRCNIDCPTFAKCGGCAYRHIKYDSEVNIKAKKIEDAMRRIGKIDIAPKSIISAERPDFYRNKAQFPFDTEKNYGFFAVHSHRVVPVEKCYLEPGIFGQIADTVSDFLKEFDVSVYSEETGRGLFRHLYLRLAEATGEIMVVFVINGNSLPNSDILIERLKLLPGLNLKSVQININKKDTNVILGEKCTVLYGEGYITDEICGIKVKISPLSFYQVNRKMAELLYNKAGEYAVPSGKTVLDLYCGTGTIGLTMAKYAKKIIGAEIVPDAIEDAKFNARLNGIGNAEFICADATSAAAELMKRKLKPDVVILDPPRKGCDAKLIETVANGFSPERVVYVSCDPATLARDCALFSEYGYKVIEYTPVDMFPRTYHVETVALISNYK